MPASVTALTSSGLGGGSRHITNGQLSSRCQLINPEGPGAGIQFARPPPLGHSAQAPGPRCRTLTRSHLLGGRRGGSWEGAPDFLTRLRPLRRPQAPSLGAAFPPGPGAPHWEEGGGEGSGGLAPLRRWRLVSGPGARGTSFPWALQALAPNVKAGNRLHTAPRPSRASRPEVQGGSAVNTRPWALGLGNGCEEHGRPSPLRTWGWICVWGPGMGAGVAWPLGWAWEKH